MPKITEVIPQKKNPHRFNIFLDGAFAFGADEDLVVEHRLVLGKLLDTSDVEKLLFESEEGKLMEKMYNLFSIRQRTEQEIKDYFRIKNYQLKIKDQEQISDLVIESLIEKLKQKGMINDLEFAKAWVESRKKKKGSRVLKQELFQKGISKEVIDGILDQELSKDQQQTAEKLLEKKMRFWKNLDSMRLRKKAYEFLLRRGFEYDIVHEVVEKIIKK